MIRDLVVDMSLFYAQYEKVQPYLQNNTPAPAIERLQSPEDRAKLGRSVRMYSCALLLHQSARLSGGTRTGLSVLRASAGLPFPGGQSRYATDERLAKLDDPFSVFRCHGIQNCVNVCPKGLNPTKAIGHIRTMLLNRAT